MAIVEAYLVVAQKERDEATAISRIFEDFIGNPSDIVNKAWLYNEGMSQPRARTRAKIV